MSKPKTVRTTHPPLARSPKQAVFPLLFNQLNNTTFCCCCCCFLLRRRASRFYSSSSDRKESTNTKEHGQADANHKVSHPLSYTQHLKLIPIASTDRRDTRCLPRALPRLARRFLQITNFIVDTAKDKKKDLRPRHPQ
uniref:Uncharacterized protein n=1 Tax=Schistocephalus solidus TaxID=70667 RepID=A0A0X3PCQ1_SCHSO